jgi:hypothetical protein
MPTTMDPSTSFNDNEQSNNKQHLINDVIAVKNNDCKLFIGFS